MQNRYCITTELEGEITKTGVQITKTKEPAPSAAEL